MLQLNCQDSLLIKSLLPTCKISNKKKNAGKIRPSQCYVYKSMRGPENYQILYSSWL